MMHLINWMLLDLTTRGRGNSSGGGGSQRLEQLVQEKSQQKEAAILLSYKLMQNVNVI